MNILTILAWLKSHWKVVVKGICAASVAFLLLWGISAHTQNKKLSKELEIAQNNIEAYQGLLDSSWQANNVLVLDFQNLKDQHDAALQRIDSIRNELNIKKNSVKTAATQTQSLNVIGSKEVKDSVITILNDSVYSDSIKFNDQTSVYYTIGKDTVKVILDIENDQYLFINSVKEYKNKKNFIQRLFTWDFKKVIKTKYTLYNTNNLIKSTDVRVVETKTN